MSANRKNDDNFTRRALIAGAAGGVLWTGLIGRLIQLQLVEGDEYARLARENRIRLDPAPARRGIIYDRFGQKLASNKRNFYVMVVPEEVRDLEGVLRRLQDLLPDQVSDRKVKRILSDAARQAKFVPIPVADDMTWEEFSRVNVYAPEFQGVYAEVGELRSYPKGASFAHTIGYVARPNARDLSELISAHAAARNIAPDDTKALKALRRQMTRIYRHPDMRIGKQGIEASAETYLRGEPGYQRVAVNAAGRIVERLASDETAPKPGGDLVLSFDSEIQSFAISRFGQESGSAVVMHIETGEIVAMASTPAFNPNDFVSGISSAKYRELADDTAFTPLYHKAYDGIYPPGSTFKMVVAAAALEAGVIKPEERIYCGGKYRFGGRDFHCWKRGGHGSVNLHTGIQKSCDVYFYEIARRMGVQKIADMAKRFGLGHVYELGMTGGRSGVVPDPAWKKTALNEPWYEGETLNYGIGQGYLTTSPLQLAVMTARIARSDAAHSPRVYVDGVQQPEDDPPAFDPPSEDIVNRLRAGMFAVTSEAGGTALRSGDLGDGVRLAGKTGTAQVRRISEAERLSGVIKNEDLDRRLRDHALFVSYAPADNPKYVCTVVVEHGGGGSAVAAPIARDIMKKTLERDPCAQPHFTVEQPMAAAQSDETEAS